MSKQKIGIIIQWIFGILFIIAGIGSFGNSIPYAIANLLFGVSLLPILWNHLRKKHLFLNKWIRIALSTGLFII